MSARTLPRVRTEPTLVDVTPYLQSHGRRPRRNDYGTWIFTLGDVTIERTGEFLNVKRGLASEGIGGLYVLQP